jgi:hypothetical protein
LVGGFNHLEKYESQWEGLSHILWKNKKCSKPQTSLPAKMVVVFYHQKIDVFPIPN